MLADLILDVFMLVFGLIFAIPFYVKFIACKDYVRGKIVKADESKTGDNKIRAIYEYDVDGRVFEKYTLFPYFTRFVTGGECDVLYNKKNPQIAYIKRTGMIIACVAATFIAVLGIVSLIVDLFF